jgi:hypothetical protein
MHTPLDGIGVIGRESPMPDERQVDIGQSCKLAVEQDRRAHLDVADERFHVLRESQSVDEELHRQRGLSRPRRSTDESDEPRPDFDPG